MRCNVEKPQIATVYALSNTVELCSANQSDPWFLKDPWTRAARSVQVAQTSNVSTQLQEIEERVEQSILQRLPAERMETDENDARIQALEQQMQHLASRQQSLEGEVTEQHKQHTAQVQGLQTQVVSQMEAQRSQMETLFESQMIRLEAILAKKGRFE
jgi:predicted RNase H-like nuclease (RuvC/YqgF family)